VTAASSDTVHLVTVRCPVAGCGRKVMTVHRIIADGRLVVQGSGNGCRADRPGVILGAGDSGTRRVLRPKAEAKRLVRERNGAFTRKALLGPSFGFLSREALPESVILAECSRDHRCGVPGDSLAVAIDKAAVSTGRAVEIFAVDISREHPTNGPSGVLSIEET